VANGVSAASGDPFVNFIGLDFRLKAATAPGITLQVPFSVDPLGKTRGADSTSDRGAFEFDGVGGVAPLLAPSNLRVM
jgi:hypothetical protein